MSDPLDYDIERAAIDLAIAVDQFNVSGVDINSQAWIEKTYQFMTGRNLNTGNAELNRALQTLIDTSWEEQFQADAPDHDGFFDRIISGAVDFTIRAARTVGIAIANVIKSVSEPFMRLFTKAGAERAEDEAKATIDMLVAKGFLDAKAIDQLTEIIGSKRWATALAPGAVMIGMLLGTLKTVFGTATGDYQKQMLSVFTPNAPSVENLIRHYYLGAIDDETLDRKMGQLGYSEEDRNLIVQSAIQTLPVDYLRILYLRGVIDLEETHKGLRKLGFNDDRLTQIIEAWNYIPSVQDILYLAGKESFEPDIVSKYGYDAEFPADQLPYLRANGMSEEMGRHFWYAHWETPSINQGYEMLHRGVISVEELDDLFKTVEIPPYWRDKLKAISYAPYTRVDIRRMYKEGVVSESEVLRTYKDLGYDEEHAANLTRWTVLDVQDESRSTTRTQIESYYKNGFLERTKAAEFLESIGYSQTDAELMLSAIDHEKYSAIEVKRVSLIERMYKDRRMERTTVQSELNAIGLTSAEIAFHLEEWDYERENDTKLPSKTDLDSFVASGVINLSTYVTEMKKLGYNDTYVNMYRQLLINTVRRAANEVGQDIVDQFGETIT